PQSFRAWPAGCLHSVRRMTQSAMQLTITIPDGAAAGSVLSIPVKGRPENVKAKVPVGLGPGDTMVLTQLAGTDEWVEESVLKQAEQEAANAVFGDVQPTSLVPPGVQLPEEADLGPLLPSGPVAHTVRLDTTVGTLDIIVRPDWAPCGARRFLQLAYCGDLDGLAFYRAVRGCLAQFGLPAKRQWPPLPDDAQTGVPFLLGAVCFAAAGENSRKSTLFICTGDMSHCFGGSPWETPIGAVAEASLDVLERIETCYGDIAECDGTGPDTGRIHAEGNSYLQASFPKLTYIRTARCLDWPPPKGTSPGSEVIAPQDMDPHAFSSARPGPAIDIPVEVMKAPKASPIASQGVTINTTPSAVQMAQASQATPSPLPSSHPASYTLPAQMSFEQQAQRQANMLLSAASSRPCEAVPVTTASSVQLVPASLLPCGGPCGGMCGGPCGGTCGGPCGGTCGGTCGGSYVPPPVARTGSYVPPPAYAQPALGNSPAPLSMPALGPPLGQPGISMPGPNAGFPCSLGGPCGTVRPRSGSLQAPPGSLPGLSGPSFPGVPSMPAMPSAMPGAMPSAMPGAMPGAVRGAMPAGMPCGMPGSLPGAVPGAMPAAVPGGMPGALPGAVSMAGRDPANPFNFQGLQMPQLTMPTLGGMPGMPQGPRPDFAACWLR
ncbi:unnamed protein product, partial [Effrenium voratum]